MKSVAQEKNILKPQTKQKQCVHHWIIESPDGPTSFGICKKCGLVKEFLNNWQDSLINGNNHSNYNILTHIIKR